MDSIRRVMTDFITKNWEIISGMIGTAVVWWGSQKLKRQSEKTSELENMKTVREIEKSLLEDMQGQVNKLIEQNNYFKKVINEQEKIINKYVKKYGEL